MKSRRRGAEGRGGNEKEEEKRRRKAYQNCFINTLYSSTITAKVSWPAFLISFICSWCCSCKVYKHNSWTWWSTPWLSKVFDCKQTLFVVNIIIKCPFTWRRAYFSFCLESNSERFFDSSSRVLSFSRSASKSFWKETDICCTYSVHMFSSEQYLLSDWWRNILQR